MDNDYELLYLAKDNEEEAIRLLEKKYDNLLYKKAIKYSKGSSIFFDDYLNEAKLALYEAIDSYQDDNTFMVYLNACVENSLANYKKSFGRNKNRILNEASSIDGEEALVGLYGVCDESFNPETILFEEDAFVEMIDKIKRMLTWNEELVFNLQIQNYTAREIAEITDNSLKTVYNIISRIRNKVVKLVSC